MNKIIFLFLICTILSCTKEKEINQEYGKIPNQIINVFESINNNQKFEINTSKSNTIVGKKGTILIIPENSIVNNDGDIIKGIISLEIKENFNKADYITSNLQTIHNNRILETLGMIYLTAKDKNGNKLKIADGKTIRVQIPQSRPNQDATIFLGERDQTGLIDWNIKKETEKTLVPFPIKFISKSKTVTECSDYYGITTDTIKNQYFTHYGDISDYENTLLATKEFADRYNQYCSDSLVKIYIDNLDKNLWEIDEMMVKYLIKDSIRRVNYYLKDIPPGPNGGPRTKAQIEANEWLINNTNKWSEREIKVFKYFASLRQTKIDTTKRVDISQLTELDRVLMSYDAMEFGWINVDFFYDDPKAVPIKLAIKTTKNASLTNLILEKRNVILSGIEKTTNEYWFTKNEDGYNKLPKGEKAIIISIGFDNNEFTFGEKTIIIGEKEEETIEMKPISESELKENLNKYGS
jgi:hypothetical protein